MTNTEAIEGHCSICDIDIYPGEARMTTLEHGTVHWECYEDD